MMLCALLLVSHIAFTTGFSNGECSHRTLATKRFRSTIVLRMSTEEEFERPKVQIKRIVESLSSGEKKGSEVELELKAVETERKLLILSTGVAGSVIGLVTGGIIDGTLAGGNAAWAGPVCYAVFGAAAYYGVTQEKNSEVSELLISSVGKPTLKAVKSALVSIQDAIVEAKASAIKKVEDTVDDIVRVPVSIRDSIVDAKDDAVSKVKAFPGEVQTAAIKSYEDAKQSAIQQVDNKVAELKAIPTSIQEKSNWAANNAKNAATKKAEAIVDDIKASPQRLLDAIITKAEATAADIAKIPDTAVSKAQAAYSTKKQEITDTIDKNVNAIKSIAGSVLPSDDKKAI